MARTMAAAVAGTALLVATTLAQTSHSQTPHSPLAPAFGNTLVSTYPDGRTSKLWLDPDGTFEGRNRKDQPNSGKWEVSKDRLCMKQYKPFFYPFSYCTPLQDPASAGGGWKAKAPTGEPITVRLVKGRS